MFTDKPLVSSQAIDALLYVSEGDMRKAITYLQSVARLKGEETLTKSDVYDIAGVRNYLTWAQNIAIQHIFN